MEHKPWRLFPRRLENDIYAHASLASTKDHQWGCLSPLALVSILVHQEI